eukprot:Gb_20990 [translate_table: standard]
MPNLDGHLRAVLGASGGVKITAGTTELFLNYFMKMMDPLSSVIAPRVYHQLIPNVVSYENWTTVTGDHIELPRELRRALQRRGHKLLGVAEGATCQLVVHDLQNPAYTAETPGQYLQKNVVHGKLTAVSDPRKGGFPSGF